MSSDLSVEPANDTSAEKALQANVSHQHALNQYAQQLTAELKKLEELMSSITTEDVEEEVHAEVQISGARKAQGLCPISEFLNPESPFFEDASSRSRHLSCTVEHPMKAKELDTLTQAIRSENMRLQAYETQKNGPDATSIDLENNTEGINWTVVAEKVSSLSAVKRTAEQCRIKWIGDRHPMINHSSWSSTELGKLKGLVSAASETNDGKVDWVQISKELGTNRTPIDCLRHGLTRQRHIWHPEADQKLAEGVKLYGINNWNLVARFVSEDATASQCQGRYYRAIDPSRKRGSWANEETERLKVAVAAYGNSWVEVAACIPNRTNEQCRERWMEHSSLSSANILWSEVDDNALATAYDELGNRWTAISSKMNNGSNGQQCRTRWEKIQRMQALQQPAAGPSRESPDSSSAHSSATRSGARSRKVSLPSVNPPDEDVPVNTATTRPKPRLVRKGKEKEETVDLSRHSSPVPSETPSDRSLATELSNKKSFKNLKKRVADGVAGKNPTKKKRMTSKGSREGTLADISKASLGPGGALAIRTPSRKVGRPRKSAGEIILDSNPNVETIPVTDAAGAPPIAPGPRPKPRPRGRPPKGVTVPPDVGSAAEATKEPSVPNRGQGSSAPPLTATSHTVSVDSVGGDEPSEVNLGSGLTEAVIPRRGRGRGRSSRFRTLRDADSEKRPARQSTRIAARSAQTSSHMDPVIT